MKHLIVSLAAVVTTALSPAFANGTTDDPRAEKTFAREFAGAQQVKWMHLDDGYLQARFLLNGVATETYFDADGELLGTVRNILYNQLPLAVMQTVTHRFTGGIVIEIKEITNGDGTNYKVTLEQKNKKYFVRLNSLGEVTGVQKEKLRK